MTRQFNETERAILGIVQKNLPNSLNPYADIAQAVGTNENTVLNLLQELKDSGVIRRFGASIKHQKVGYSHNAMVAWVATEEQATQLGPKAADNPRVSHCYYRPSSAQDWPYTLYTMVHGRSLEECMAAVEELRSTLGLTDFSVLESIKELKKVSMTYF